MIYDHKQSASAVNAERKAYFRPPDGPKGGS